MSRFIALFTSAISEGAIVTLAALGFLLTQRATGVVSFAQGDMITLGAYLAVWAAVDLSLPIGIAYIVAIVLLFGAGVLLERFTHAPLKGRSIHVVVIATLGAAIVVRALLGRWKGADPVSLRSPFTGRTVNLFGAAVPVQRIAIMVVTLAVVVAMVWLLQKTQFGRQVRAIAADRETARLCGVPTTRLAMISFGLSGALAGLAGVLLGPLAPFDLTLGFHFMLGGFAAAILGGYGSIWGALLGGMIIGLSQELLGGYVLRDYKNAIPFVLLLVVMAVRPQGLLGSGHGRL